MFTKYFTPLEATRCLPLVRKIVTEILTKGQRIKAILAQDATEELVNEIQVLEDEMNDLMRELEELGCFFKDWNFEIGLVDFPAMVNGQPVMLCWRSDESKLRWYHGIEEGYASRKLIPENLFDDELAA
jgi:hypothetical protein